MNLPVVHTTQIWRTFKNLPGEEIEGIEDGYGPSGMHLWIYIPSRDYVSDWANWSGSPADIKYLKKEKALWCYKTPPMIPDGIK